MGNQCYSYISIIMNTNNQYTTNIKDRNDNINHNHTTNCALIPNTTNIKDRKNCINSKQVDLNEVVITGYVRSSTHNNSSIIVTINQIIKLYCISTKDPMICAIGYGQDGGFGMGDNYLRAVKYWIPLNGFSKIICNSKNLLNNADIIQGKSRYFILTSNRRQIYACGKNQNFQCGLGPNSPRILNKYTKVNLDFMKNNAEYIHIVSNGKLSDHQIVITNKGKILGWGQNRYNQLAPNSLKKFVARETIQYPTDLSNSLFNIDINAIKQIECGFSHTVFLTTNGKVFSLGNNEEGQCGLGIYKKYILNATLINKIPNISQICVGEHFCNLIDINGLLWTFGHNHICKYFCDYQYIFEPISHKYVFNGNGLDYEMDCGMEHCIVLNMSSGECWILGNNRCGQLGVNVWDEEGGSDQYLSPQKFQSINGAKYELVKVVKISAGNLHSVLLDSRNNLYVFGFNLFKQCHVNEKRRICKPQILTKKQIGIEDGENCYVEQIFAGVATTFVKIGFNNKLTM
eukprot:103093_1